MTAQKVLHPSVEKELKKDLARPGQDQHEGHERPTGATDLHMAEVPPIDLAHFSGHRREAQIGLGRRPRSVHRNDMAEMVRAAAIAALAHHRVDATRGERRKTLQCLADERQVRVGFGGSQRSLRRWYAGAATRVARFRDERVVGARLCRRATSQRGNNVESSLRGLPIRSQISLPSDVARTRPTATMRSMPNPRAAPTTAERASHGAPNRDARIRRRDRRRHTVGRLRYAARRACIE